MAIPNVSGTATATVKVADLNNLIAAINTELGFHATRQTLEELRARVAALEGVPAPVIPPDLTDRVAALENEPDVILPPDLTDRVTALEALIIRSPVENPLPPSIPGTYEPLPKPEGLDPNSPALIYDKATIYLGDMELHAVRIDTLKWRLFARLNYIVLAAAEWTYDEIVEGTPDEVYQHALRRLEELAALKPQHDAVHSRVKEMSEGR